MVAAAEHAAGALGRCLPALASACAAISFVPAAQAALCRPPRPATAPPCHALCSRVRCALLGRPFPLLLSYRCNHFNTASTHFVRPRTFGSTRQKWRAGEVFSAGITTGGALRLATRVGRGAGAGVPPTRQGQLLFLQVAPIPGSVDDPWAWQAAQAVAPCAEALWCSGAHGPAAPRRRLPHTFPPRRGRHPAPLLAHSFAVCPNFRGLRAHRDRHSEGSRWPWRPQADPLHLLPGRPYMHAVANWGVKSKGERTISRACTFGPQLSAAPGVPPSSHFLCYFMLNCG